MVVFEPVNVAQARVYFDWYLSLLDLDLSRSIAPVNSHRLEPFERAGAAWYLAPFLTTQPSSEPLASSYRLASYESTGEFPSDLAHVSQKLVRRAVRKRDWSRMIQAGENQPELLRDGWLTASSAPEPMECDTALDLLERFHGFSFQYLDAASRANRGDKAWELANRSHPNQHGYQTAVVTALLEALGPRAMFDWGREQAVPFEVWNEVAPRLSVFEPSFNTWFEKSFQVSAAARKSLSHKALVVRACSGDSQARNAVLVSKGRARFEAELEIFFADLRSGRFSQALTLIQNSVESSQTQLRYELLFEAMWLSGQVSDAILVRDDAPQRRKPGMIHRLVLGLAKAQPTADVMKAMERLGAKPDETTLPICIWRAALDDDGTAEPMFKKVRLRPKIASQAAQLAALGFCDVRDVFSQPFP